jgi:putative CocE/NonD family hydrolase
MNKTLIVERDVETPMRDGVILRADVYRPHSDAGSPVLLQRTPYLKSYSQLSFAINAAERGYAVVIQDTRGCGNSEGDSYPFIHEKEDGYDSVQWAARQPWSNGRVGMFGGSYVGYTQYAAAALQPPALQTITPAITFTDPHSTSYKGGALELGATITWGLTAWALPGAFRMQANLQQASLLAEVIDAINHAAQGEIFKTLPLADMPLIGQDGFIPLLGDLLARGPQDNYWQQVACAWDQIKVPALHIGGWYDMFIDQTLRDFYGMRHEGNPAQKAIIGPWFHGSFESLVGQVDCWSIRSFMTRLTRCPHMAVVCAASPLHYLPELTTSARLKPARMYWCSPQAHLNVIWKSPARLKPTCGQPALLRIRISLQN